MPLSIFTSFLTAALLNGAIALQQTSPATDAEPATEASTGPQIATLTVDIWPEFDDPRVLVIYDGRLAAGAAVPVDFSFIVPSDARIHMAGGIAADGGHLPAAFETRVLDDGVKEVSYRLEVPRFYMEFYYDPLTGAGQRRFSYPVVSRFDIDSLLLRVQEPLRSEGFGVVPLAEEVVQDNRGLNYSLIRFDHVSAGAEMPVTVSYRKTDRQPSVAGNAAAPDQAPAERETTSSPWERARTWILGTLATGFFAMGFFKMFSSRAGKQGGAPERQGSAPPSASGGAGRFCTECGRPAGPADRYCGQCGHRLDG